VEARVVPGRTVTIRFGCGGAALVSVPQRDLYAKYGHPARGVIVKNLELFRAQQ